MRSAYVYLIFQGTTLLSVHTVKYEAQAWLRASTWKPEEVSFCRMHDGGMSGKCEKLVEMSQLEAMA